MNFCFKILTLTITKIKYTYTSVYVCVQQDFTNNSLKDFL